MAVLFNVTSGQSDWSATAGTDPDPAAVWRRGLWTSCGHLEPTYGP